MATKDDGILFLHLNQEYPSAPSFLSITSHKNLNLNENNVDYSQSNMSKSLKDDLQSNKVTNNQGKVKVAVFFEAIVLD